MFTLHESAKLNSHLLFLSWLLRFLWFWWKQWKSRLLKCKYIWPIGQCRIYGRPVQVVILWHKYLNTISTIIYWVSFHSSFACILQIGHFQAPSHFTQHYNFNELEVLTGIPCPKLASFTAILCLTNSNSMCKASVILSNKLGSSGSVASSPDLGLLTLEEG